MNSAEGRNITIERVAAILGWSFLFNYAILLLWVLLFLSVPDWLYGMNEILFPITRHDFVLVNYYGMALLKIINIAFFLCPYLSIKLFMRRKPVNG